MSRRASMRLTIAAIALLLVLVLGGREASWRLDHPLMQAAAASPGGSQVAEIRSMPEHISARRQG